MSNRPTTPPITMKTLFAILFICAALAIVVRADLAAWWAFDGSFSDISAGSNDGISTPDAPSFDAAVPAGIAGQSVKFATDTQAVTVVADPSLDAAVFTLCYFINQQNAVQGNAGLERLTSRAGDTFETAIGDAHVLGEVEDGISKLSYYSPGTGWTNTGVLPPAAGWTHVAWRNTASNMELYIDGVLSFTGPAIPAPTGAMSIGARNNTGPVEGFEGLMADVFLWDDSTNELTPASITAIAASGLSAFLGDADNDGLPDFWEEQHTLDANDNGEDQPPFSPVRSGPKAASTPSRQKQIPSSQSKANS
ncbi:MAG: LamG-like jellyroll fold domain-containing protein [Akkermansiaceae bacterium]